MTSKRIPVDLVIIIDTSASMGDEAEKLSLAAEAAIKAAKSNCPSDLRTVWLGLEGIWPNTNFDKNTRDYLVNTCKVNEADIKSSMNEDGARAIEDFSIHFDWRPEAKRAIFYLSDEGLEKGGEKSDSADISAADQAIRIAEKENVIVHTYFGTPQDGTKEEQKTLQEEYARVSKATNGQAFTAEDTLEGFEELLKTVICISKEAPPLPTLPEPATCLVDLVIAIDTSESMQDEAVGLSLAAELAIEAAQSDPSIDLRVVWLGLEGTWDNTCFERTVRDYLTKECNVNEADIRCRKWMPETGSGPREDGARTIEDISTHFDWRPEAVRAILYLSDEGLDGGGSMVTKRDVEAADLAIKVALTKQVVVHTYFGKSKSIHRQALQEEYARVSEATKGRAWTEQDTLEGFAELLQTVIRATKESAPLLVSPEPTFDPPPNSYENPFTDLMERLKQMMDQSTTSSHDNWQGSRYSFHGFSELDEKFFTTYERNERDLTQIHLEVKKLQSNVSEVMRASIQSEELHEIAMEGENAIRKWQSAMEKANQQREEAQKTVDSILYDLNTTLARVQVAQDLFVTEREELWNRWTAFQQGEFSETVRISLKKEQKEKAIALEEAARLRKRVESLEERLKEAEQLLARKEKSVAEVQVIEMEVSKKLQELRTLQLNLDRFQQEIQTKNEVYESWRKRSQEREVQLREEIEERDKKIQTQGYELETNKRRYESLKERLTQVEREFQKTEEVKSRYSELTATVKTHYVHKDEMKRMITIFFDSFAEEIRELERGAEKHEGELQERLDWTESLSGKLEMWVAQIGKFVTFEEKQVSESVTVESVTIETNVETTQVQSQTETSNASASSVASSVVSTAD